MRTAGVGWRWAGRGIDRRRCWRPGWVRGCRGGDGGGGSALGRQRDRQSEVLVTWSELPRSPGHVFYDRLQSELIAAGFDGVVAGPCVPHYPPPRGRAPPPAR